VTAAGKNRHMWTTWHSRVGYHMKAVLVFGDRTVAGPGKVAICNKCPNVPAAGIWLPAWTNAVAMHRATTCGRRTIATNREFAGALRTVVRPQIQ
jgi:hypothetical protein